VYGAQAPRDAVTLGLGLARPVFGTGAAFLRYDGALAAAVSRHALGIGLSFRW